MEPLPTPPLPCPECRAAGRGGSCRLGNHRDRCATCNNWNQNVRRITRNRFAAKYPEEFQRIRLEVERDLYPQVMENWVREHPSALRPEEIDEAAE